MVSPAKVYKLSSCDGTKQPRNATSKSGRTAFGYPSIVIQRTPLSSIFVAVRVITNGQPVTMNDLIEHGTTAEYHHQRISLRMPQH